MEHKGYKILTHPRFATRVIQAIGKGALPKILMGSFSDERRAMQAIDTYVSVKSKKGASNAKTDRTTGSK